MPREFVCRIETGGENGCRLETGEKRYLNGKSVHSRRFGFFRFNLLKFGDKKLTFFYELVLVRFEVVASKLVEMCKGVLEASGNAAESFDGEEPAEGNHFLGVSALVQEH